MPAASIRSSADATVSSCAAVPVALEASAATAARVVLAVDVLARQLAGVAAVLDDERRPDARVLEEPARASATVAVDGSVFGREIMTSPTVRIAASSRVT